LTRIALVTGGSTPERDVALAGASQVAPALRGLGHEVVVVDTVEGTLDAARETELLDPAVDREPPSPAELAALAARENLPALVAGEILAGFDLLFLVLHGGAVEGGQFQALLELAGLRFTGSGALASALAMHKSVAKRLLREAGIPTAEWVRLPATAGELEALGWPRVVKPSNAGSSVGISVAHGPEELAPAIEAARAVDADVLVERYLPGRELTVGVVGGRALGVGEIVPSHELFDYECKYTPGMTREIFPAEIPPALASRVRELALATHRALDLRDFSRVDVRLDAAGAPHVLEANTLPGMTPTSLLPQSAAVEGIGFAALCDEICRLALARPA
jgi:D-alanine-D-alanine ligase